MQRFGQVILLKDSEKEEYIRLHNNPRPEINAMIKACNMSNYSIYYRDGFLFAYFEYTGDNFEMDMKKMADDPNTQAWWNLVKPMQSPIDSIKEGEWWADMEEVYHLD